MSKLSDFFPGGAPGTNVTVIMVGGGGGAGTCGGAGGGGYFYGIVPVTPGVSYPVVIGTGGAPGNPASCATTAGLGNPGSPSKFGRYEALGGGGGATICSTSFGIPGASGGSAGGNQTGCGPTSPCGCPFSCIGFVQSGASQRSSSPIGYCGALGSRAVGNPPYGPLTCCIFDLCCFVRRNTGTVVCPEFFGVCLASVPYTYSPAPTVPTIVSPSCMTAVRAGCIRSFCGVPFSGCPSNYAICCVIGNCPNTGFGAYCPACNGDSGVVLVAYPCVLPAATSFPGAVDCSPVSLPQNNFRTYKFTSSGSFTL